MKKKTVLFLICLNFFFCFFGPVSYGVEYKKLRYSLPTFRLFHTFTKKWSETPYCLILLSQVNILVSMYIARKRIELYDRTIHIFLLPHTSQIQNYIL